MCCFELYFFVLVDGNDVGVVDFICFFGEDQNDFVGWKVCLCYMNEWVGFVIVQVVVLWLFVDYVVY